MLCYDEMREEDEDILPDDDDDDAGDDLDVASPLHDVLHPKPSVIKTTSDVTGSFRVFGGGATGIRRSSNTEGGER